MSTLSNNLSTIITNDTKIPKEFEFRKINSGHKFLKVENSSKLILEIDKYSDIDIIDSSDFFLDKDNEKRLKYIDLLFEIMLVK